MLINVVNMVDMLDNVDLVNKLWTWWASGGLWAGRQETAAGQAALPTGSQARESHVLHGFNDPASSSETRSGWPGLVWSSSQTQPPVLPSSPGAGAGLCLPLDHPPGLLEITFEMTMTTKTNKNNAKTTKDRSLASSIFIPTKGRPSPLLYNQPIEKKLRTKKLQTRTIKTKQNKRLKKPLVKKVGETI